jgi:hypothetical protein
MKVSNSFLDIWSNELKDKSRLQRPCERAANMSMLSWYFGRGGAGSMFSFVFILEAFRNIA